MKDIYTDAEVCKMMESHRISGLYTPEKSMEELSKIISLQQLLRCVNMMIEFGFDQLNKKDEDLR